MCRTPCLLRVYGYERKIMVLIITVLSEVSHLEQQFFLICLCLCLRINIFLTHPFIPAVIKITYCFFHRWYSRYFSFSSIVNLI